MGTFKSAMGFEPGWCQKGSLGSAKGFGPWTFGYGKVSQVHGKVSLFKWTLESAPGFEPGILIRTRNIGACVRTRGVLTDVCHDGVLGPGTPVTRIGTRVQLSADSEDSEMTEEAATSTAACTIYIGT